MGGELGGQAGDFGVDAVFPALEVPDVFPIVALEQAAGFVALGGEAGDAGAFHQFPDELGHGVPGAAHELLGDGEEGGIRLGGAGQLVGGSQRGAGGGREMTRIEGRG